MILAGAFVAGRMFFGGVQAAQIAGWAFSPIFHLYAIAVFSMVVLGAVSLFSRSSLLLAPAIIWSVFLLLSAITEIVEIQKHLLADVNIIILHIAYNSITVILMLFFMALLRRCDYG